MSQEKGSLPSHCDFMLITGDVGGFVEVEYVMSESILCIKHSRSEAYYGFAELIPFKMKMS